MYKPKVISKLENSAVKNNKRLLNVYIIIMIVSLILASVLMFSTKIIYNLTLTANYMFSLVGLVFSIVLIICIALGNFTFDKKNVAFTSAIILLYFSTFINCLSFISCAYPKLFLLTNVLVNIYYILEYLMSIPIIIYIIQNLPKRKTDAFIIYFYLGASILYAVLVIFNNRYGYMYTIQNGFIHYNKNDIVSTIYTLIMIIVSTLYIMTAKCSIKKRLILNSPVFFLFVGFLINVVAIIKGINYDIDLSGIFNLISFYIIFFNIFAQQNNELNMQKAKNEELKTAIMLSQIQPHFLYNSLTAIRRLCLDDPKLAAKAIEYFSDYLRMNMNTLQNSRQLISFKDELEHIKTYLWIEQMRFGDELNIVYDIQCDDFMLPSLSVQPLVENAVKHGVCQRENGGTVTISTRREQNGAVIITVHDDGIGFDPDKIYDDGKNHIGISNIRTRLEMLSCGKLFIDSKLGEYTTAKIILSQDGVE